MMRTVTKAAVCLITAFTLLAAQDRTLSQDNATTLVGAPLHLRATGPVDGTGTPGHPFTVIARHPKAGCADTAVCGDIYYTYTGHNLRTSAGTTWQYNQMAGTTAAVGTYLALTNTAITPQEADTTLSGEIATNGLSRANSTPTNASTTLSVPAAPTAAVVGTAGSTTYYYWVEACNQGVCTTLSPASTPVTTANATLSTTNYVSVTWTPIPGAASYQLLRTTTSSAPSGTVSDLVGNVAACSATTCTQLDTSNSLTSVTVPSSNLTNMGKYTLVYTWTCSGSAQQAQAYGVLNAASSGTLVFEGTFTQVSLNPGDTFQLVESVYY